MVLERSKSVKKADFRKNLIKIGSNYSKLEISGLGKPNLTHRSMQVAKNKLLGIGEDLGSSD
jgi:hypothetical protein